MSSLYTQQTRNIQRTFLLMALFLAAVIAIAWFVSLYVGSPSILYIAVFLALGLNFYAYWKSDVIAIRLTKARPITRKEHFDYWTAVENICMSIGAPQPKLYVIDDPSPNAFATGRSPKHAAIAATTGLLEMMDKAELEGVVAHELAHIQNRDTLLMTVVVVLFGMVTILLDIILHSAFFFSDEEDGAAGLLILIPLYFLAPLVLTIIRLAVSRKREFLADATAGIYTRYPDGLASALRKIQNSSQPMQHARSATAHLFISDPFLSRIDDDHKKGGKKRLPFASLFDTHPPTDERIRALLGTS